MVSPWNLKIFTQGSGFSWLFLSKKDMMKVMCCVQRGQGLELAKKNSWQYCALVQTS
jgi:hypothetical protein